MSTKIGTFGLGKLNNAEHVNFHAQVMNFVDLATPTAISLTPEQRLAYLDIQEREQDVVKRQQASAITPQLETIDHERDQLVAFLLTTIDNAAKSPVATQKEAYAQLKPVVKPYTGIGSHANAQETAEIIGLLRDLSAEPLGKHLGALALSPVIEALESSNLSYQQLDAQRTAQIPSKADTDKIRQEADAAYQQIVDLANATLLLKPSDAVSTFVQNINNLIKHTQDAYNLRMGVAEANKEKKQKQA